MKLTEEEKIALDFVMKQTGANIFSNEYEEVSLNRIEIAKLIVKFVYTREQIYAVNEIFKE